MMNTDEKACRNCRHFAPLGTRVAEGEAVIERGQCRARPPVIVSVAGEFTPNGRFPLMQADEWCGKFRRKKVKKMPRRRPVYEPD